MLVQCAAVLAADYSAACQNTKLPQMTPLRLNRSSVELTLQALMEVRFLKRETTEKTNTAATATIRGMVSNSYTTPSSIQSSLKT